MTGQGQFALVQLNLGKPVENFALCGGFRIEALEYVCHFRRLHEYWFAETETFTEYPLCTRWLQVSAKHYISAMDSVLTALTVLEDRK